MPVLSLSLGGHIESRPSRVRPRMRANLTPYFFMVVPCGPAVAILEESRIDCRRKTGPSTGTPSPFNIHSGDFARVVARVSNLERERVRPRRTLVDRDRPRPLDDSHRPPSSREDRSLRHFVSADFSPDSLKIRTMLALVNVTLTFPSSSSRSWTRSPWSSTESTVPYIPDAVRTLSF